MVAAMLVWAWWRGYGWHCRSEAPDVRSGLWRARRTLRTLCTQMMGAALRGRIWWAGGMSLEWSSGSWGLV